MTKFYICTTDIPKGPYRIDELDQLNLNSDDLIWSDEYGMNVKAKEIPEFAPYFKKKNIYTYTPQFSRNYTPSYQSIILSVLLSLLLFMVAYYIIAV